MFRPIDIIADEVLDQLTGRRGDAVLIDLIDVQLALTTTALLLIPISVVGVVLAWADLRARHRETTEERPSILFESLFADREDGLGAGLQQRGREMDISRDPVGLPPNGPPGRGDTPRP